MTVPGPARAVDLQQIAVQLDRDLPANGRPGITNANQLDVHALCVAEEAGGTGRRVPPVRAQGSHTRTLRELEDEEADMPIVTAMFERAGIHINAAIGR